MHVRSTSKYCDHKVVQIKVFELDLSYFQPERGFSLSHLLGKRIINFSHNYFTLYRLSISEYVAESKFRVLIKHVFSLYAQNFFYYDSENSIYSARLIIYNFQSIAVLEELLKYYIVFQVRTEYTAMLLHVINFN